MTAAETLAINKLVNWQNIELLATLKGGIDVFALPLKQGGFIISWKVEGEAPVLVCAEEDNPIVWDIKALPEMRTAYQTKGEEILGPVRSRFGWTLQ